MKHVLTQAIALAISFSAFQSDAAIFGSYIKTSKAQYYNDYTDIHWSKPIVLKDFDYPNQKWPVFTSSEYGELYPRRPPSTLYDGPGICIDATSRKVPGVIKDGYCHVEWDGRNWKNSDYYYLSRNYDYEWRKINKGYQLRGDEVTAGGWDKGAYVYHCVAEGYHWEGHQRYRLIGKYVPNLNKCFVTISDRDRSFVELGQTVPDVWDWRAKQTYVWILVGRKKSSGGGVVTPPDGCGNPGEICP
ncbi:hypothetical protein [Pseudoalteromonas sp. R3]|uniref:hypothetical protein n=1 Tax=Pseudoalteromonas sp. R3 TaxID=1709477 RepID=UPI0006B53754|nr:hypothetical protein [Pseudoalteromonas sp. R3]AZZ96951.1 hypothetical protein ELR70_07190 [Pseudoalteromonas sp. R3]